MCPEGVLTDLDSFGQICPQRTAKVNPHSGSLPVPMPTYNILSLILFSWSFDSHNCRVLEDFSGTTKLC